MAFHLPSSVSLTLGEDDTNSTKRAFENKPFSLIRFFGNDPSVQLSRMFRQLASPRNNRNIFFSRFSVLSEVLSCFMLTRIKSFHSCQQQPTNTNNNTHRTHHTRYFQSIPLGTNDNFSYQPHTNTSPPSILNTTISLTNSSSSSLLTTISKVSLKDTQNINL
jgi:hypothetical protein